MYGKVATMSNDSNQETPAREGEEVKEEEEEYVLSPPFNNTNCLKLNNHHPEYHECNAEAPPVVLSLMSIMQNAGTARAKHRLLLSRGLCA